MAGMERKFDLTGKKVSKTVQESRKPSFTETLHRRRENSSGRPHTGNMSDASQEKSVSSLPDAGMVRHKLRQQRWQGNWQENRQENRRSGGVLSQSSDGLRYRLQSQSNKVIRGDSSATPQLSDSQRRWLQSQGHKVESRPNEQKFNRRQLHKLKGGYYDDDTSGPPVGEDGVCLVMDTPDGGGLAVLTTGEVKPITAEELRKHVEEIRAYRQG
jgi:hypothetical protein